MFDDALRAAALDAGAGRSKAGPGNPLGSRRASTASPRTTGEPRADFVIGADGATSHVAQTAGLVEDARVLWGFALRCYLDQPVDAAHHHLVGAVPGRAFPGYGWIFPGPGREGQPRARHRHPGRPPAGAAAVRVLPAYLEHLFDWACSTGPRARSRGGSAVG